MSIFTIANHTVIPVADGMPTELRFSDCSMQLQNTELQNSLKGLIWGVTGSKSCPVAANAAHRSAASQGAGFMRIWMNAEFVTQDIHSGLLYEDDVCRNGILHLPRCASAYRDQLRELLLDEVAVHVSSKELKKAHSFDMTQLVENYTQHVPHALFYIEEINFIVFKARLAWHGVPVNLAIARAEAVKKIQKKVYVKYLEREIDVTL